MELLLARTICGSKSPEIFEHVILAIDAIILKLNKQNNELESFKNCACNDPIALDEHKAII